ncbi:MAG: radical SAM protein [Candidatus Muiribacteriota bacterium]
MNTIDLTLELTNKCNYRCRMCFLKNRDVLPPLFMELDTVEKFLFQLESSSYKINVLRTFWAGESLMHPDFEKIMYKLSESKKINHICFDTNGELLNSKKVEAIMDAARDKKLSVIFSVDAFCEGAYNKIRVGGNFEKVIENIKNFLKKVRENNNIKTMIQFIVQNENYNELSYFISFWKKVFTENKLDFEISLNCSMALENGVNIRPLTVQSDKLQINQAEANNLYEKALKQAGILKNTEFLKNIAQGGGKIDILSKT